MATIQELEDQIKTLNDTLDSIPDEFKDDARREISDMQSELNAMRSGSGSTPTTSKPRKVKPSTPPSSGSSASATALATLRAVMMSGEGSGVDSKEVRSMIENYLKTEKVNLTELDSDVMDFIKQNQKVILELPNFGLKIEVNQSDANIPYFFEVIDDVLAGNNVYLIGEAGGGKTYTAEEVAKKLKREYTIINCSQYTSPTEILGGQTIDGYKEGKLIDAWRKGKILILDEMPRLDPNTAGLFNDALAKSSKTREAKNALISSTNPEEPPIERNEKFALIGTGNIYPNTAPPSKYKANNQQDLSLLDRFSGSVYKVEYSRPLDELTSRFKFLYDMLIGNYYEYTEAIKNKQTPPEAKGLRTIIKDLGLDDLAVVSYRTLVSFRVAFEFELVRAIAKYEGRPTNMREGKTLQKALDSFMVAFSDSTVETLINKTKFTKSYVKSLVDGCIENIIKGNIQQTLNPSVASATSSIFKKYQDFFKTNEDFNVPDMVQP
jgi:cobaltochelatase CobS